MKKQAIQVAVSTDLVIDRSSLNGFNVMFKREPNQVRGCPMGRGVTVDAAIADLKRRVEIESPVIITWLND